jgi:hypothetical protein
MREGARRGQYPQAVGDIEAFIDEMDAWRHANNPPIERLLPDGRWVLITERSTPDGGTGRHPHRHHAAEARDGGARLRPRRGARGRRGEGPVPRAHVARAAHAAERHLGFAQVLLRDPGLSAEQREQVNTLHEAGRHLLELVNSLLDLSKIEAGKLDLQPEDVALRPLLEACAGPAGAGGGPQGLTLALDIAPGHAGGGGGDECALRQMLLNLLSNAVKFTPARRPGGPARAPLAKAGPASDRGAGHRPGRAAEKRHLLFEDFSQLPDAGSAGSRGTGLGLAISARLAAAMGGRIGCDRESGQGALFWVELPLQEVPLPAAAAGRRAGPGGHAAGGRSLRVLVARRRGSEPHGRRAPCWWRRATAWTAPPTGPRPWPPRRAKPMTWC